MTTNAIASKYVSKTAMLIAVLLVITCPAQGQVLLEHYTAAESPLPDNTVRAVLADDEEVWAGTEWGLAHVELHPGLLHTWTVYQESNSGLPDNSVRSLAQDADGNLWVGMLSGGLARFDGSTWLQYNTANSLIPGDHVRALAVDPAGPIWVGTTNGLAKFDGTTWKVFDFVAGGGESNHVASLACYAPDSLWVGLINGGLLHLQDTVATTFTLANSGMNDNTILGIARTPSGNLWMAAPAAAAINYQNLAFYNYNNFNSGNPSGSMNAVALDEADHPWFTSYDRGLVTFDGTNWRHFDSTNSYIPENFLLSLAFEEDRRTIWCGMSTQGLIRVPIYGVGRADIVHQLPAVTVYPNPATERVSIAGLNGVAGKLLVRDAQGRIVQAKEISTGSAWEMGLNVAGGMYFLEITVPKGKIVRRLLVE